MCIRRNWCNHTSIYLLISSTRMLSISIVLFFGFVFLSLSVSLFSISFPHYVNWIKEKENRTTLDLKLLSSVFLSKRRRRRRRNTSLNRNRQNECNNCSFVVHRWYIEKRWRRKMREVTGETSSSLHCRSLVFVRPFVRSFVCWWRLEQKDSMKKSLSPILSFLLSHLCSSVSPRIWSFSSSIIIVRKLNMEISRFSIDLIFFCSIYFHSVNSSLHHSYALLKRKRTDLVHRCSHKCTHVHIFPHIRTYTNLYLLGIVLFNSQHCSPISTDISMLLITRNIRWKTRSMDWDVRTVIYDKKKKLWICHRNRNQHW